MLPVDDKRLVWYLTDENGNWTPIEESSLVGIRQSYTEEEDFVEMSAWDIPDTNRSHVLNAGVVLIEAINGIANGEA